MIVIFFYLYKEISLQTLDEEQKSVQQFPPLHHYLRHKSTTSIFYFNLPVKCHPISDYSGSNLPPSSCILNTLPWPAIKLKSTKLANSAAPLRFQILSFNVIKAQGIRLN